MSPKWRVSISLIFLWAGIVALGLALISPTRAQSAPIVPSLSPARVLRPPVHPRRNVDEFRAVKARFLRFTITRCNRAEPCIDELEVYAAGTDRNIALASAGTKVTGSGSLPGYRIHRLENINDGLYGNGRSWISSETGRGWVMLEFPEATTIDRVVWGRDREGKFIDRLAAGYVIEVALDRKGPWTEVASSEDREPLSTGADFFGLNPASRQAITRFAPVGTTLTPDTRSTQSEYIVDVWQSENGLPSNTISSILQSSDGYLWLGTANGLVCFDGVRFRTYSESDGFPTSPVVCLYQSRDGDLWIGTEGAGLVRFRRGVFQAFTELDGLPSNIVLSLEEDANGQLYIGTRRGLCVWSGGKLSPVETLRGNDVLRLQHDSTGNLWGIFSGSLAILKDGQKISPRIQGEPSGFSSLFALSRGARGDLWFGGANAYIARWDNNQLSVYGKDSGLVPDDIWELCEARNGDLWIGTASGGVSRLRAGKFLNLTPQEGLSSNSIRAILEDREGNIWLGSNGGGLMRLKKRKLTTIGTRDGLSHEVVMSLAQDTSGTIWIGSNCGGLNKWEHDKATPVFVNYLLDNACIWSLLSAANGHLWIGTWGQGLFERRPNEVINYLPANGLTDDVVLALCEDRQGGLWIGTYQGGLNRLRDGKLQHFTTREGLSANFVTSLLEDRSGTLWIGTGGGGLDRYDGQHFTTFSRRDGLGSDLIRTLYEDSDGVLWMGTGGGLSRRKDGKFDTITTRHGLRDNVLSQILEDDFGNLWFGSNQGIFHIARTNLNAVMDGREVMVSPVIYGKGEGMESLECTGGFHPAGLRDRNGLLWFSTVKGLVRVDPGALKEPGIAPPVAIEEVLVDGNTVWKAIPLQTANSDAVLKVLSGAGRLEFRFTALSLTAPERILFRYRMEGLERTWSTATGNHAAQYSSLGPGAYRFLVSAANPEGVWNETGASLAFTVLPRFWETWWFLLAIVLTAAAAIAAAVRFFSLRKLRLRLERLEQQHALERERARIAQDIHDDIGATLTQIAFLSDLGEKKLVRTPEVQAQFQQISRTAREVVRSLDQIVWAVNPRNDSLDHFANYLSQFAQEFLGPTGIRCRLEFPDQLPFIQLSTEERHHLFLAAKEALHNAVKHSGASEVLVALRVNTTGFSVTVEDNGQGFPPNREAEGDGLRNMRDRLQDLAGSVEISTSPAHGTRITFHVPSDKGRLTRERTKSNPL